MDGETLVSIYKTEHGFTFNHRDDDRRWAYEMSEIAGLALTEIADKSLPRVAKRDLVGLAELQGLGFVKTSERGEVVVPVALSALGLRVAEVIAALKVEPVGVCLPCDRSTGRRKSPPNALVIGGFLIVLAISVFAFGYRALIDLSKFLGKVILDGGPLAGEATKMLVQPIDLLMQFLILVVVSAVVLLCVGATLVRESIRQAR